VSFCREKEIGGIENIYKYVKMCEEKTINNEVLELVNPPENYQKDNKIRVYTEIEIEKIMSEYVTYIDIERGGDAYLPELDQDAQFHLRIHFRDVRIYSKCEGTGWSMQLDWSENLIKELYENKDFDRSLYEKFEYAHKS